LGNINTGNLLINLLIGKLLINLLIGKTLAPDRQEVPGSNLD